MTTKPREFWIRIDPTGCVTGSVLESCVGPLAEDAHKEFTPRVADRRKEAAAGWRHELIGRDQWTRRAKPCLLGRCQHRKPTSAARGGAANG
ncbi:hypothetical protein AB0E67_27465 [Streptomyces sp. NPDC032161]|uniref:hypothetical protein n=1 Tax=unclassified Streptomyces TaxID=2593676 RepID=UPI0033E6353B